jgi:hypothetical protein
MIAARRLWIGENPVAKRIRRRFPLLYEMLRETKRMDHAQAALLMQNLEATVFINRIARRIVDELPGVWFTTIHDSILSTPEHLPAIRTIIVDEFARIGLQLTANALKEVRYEPKAAGEREEVPLRVGGC